MKVYEYIEQGSEEWKELRKGKITGTKLNGILSKRSNDKKIGFYELIAEKIATEPDDENQMDRGTRLETEAKVKAEEVLKKVIHDDVALCVSDDNEGIASSPDFLIANPVGSENYTEAGEIKCLSSARHLQAYFEKKIPSEYFEQIVQYFIVNDVLERLYFCFYDPRVTILPFHYIVVERKEVEENIKYLKELQLETLKEIDKMILELAF